MRKVIMKVCLVAAVLARYRCSEPYIFQASMQMTTEQRKWNRQQEKRTEEPNSSGTTAVQRNRMTMINDDRDDIDDADDRYDDDRYETDDNDDWDDDRYDNDDNDDVYDDDRYEKR